jgi:O-antigen/teichoic acid export membrane protein
MMTEGVIKILLAVLLVFIGWKVYGAITGAIIGAFASFFLSFSSIKKILLSKERPHKIKDVYGYSLPVFSMVATIMIFYSLDIILAKAFFPGVIAGQYAIASMLAKIIFFGTFPISQAMFPLSSEASKDKNKKHSKNILKHSLLILGFGVLVALVVFWVFPELLVRIFSGSYYDLSSKILIYLALAMGLLSFTNLILLYKLSLGKVRNYWLVFIFLAFEIILLSIFHTNLIQYSIAFLFLNVLFLFGAIFLFKKR